MRSPTFHLLVIQALVVLSGTLAGMFSIVYLVNSGLGPAEASLLYLGAFVTACLLVVFAAVRGFGRPGYWMAAGMLSLAMFYLCFMLLDDAWILLLAPPLFGIYIVSFWVPYNVLMLGQAMSRRRGETIGYFFLVYPVIGLASPIVGGHMIETLGYGILFACALVALLANCALILLGPVSRASPMKGRLIPAMMGKRLALALLFEGGQEGVWFAAIPLLSMVFVRGEGNLGYVFALFGLAGGIASVIVGRLSDRRGRRHVYVRAAALASGMTALLVALAPGITEYLVLVSLLYLLQPMLPVLLFTMAADRLERRRTSCALTREFLLNSGRVLGAIICSGILFATGDIRMAFAVSGMMLAAIAIAR